jgi:hypothetical protein
MPAELADVQNVVIDSKLQCQICSQVHVRFKQLSISRGQGTEVLAGQS